MTKVDYSRAAVDARLRRAAAASREITSATPRVPMDRAAVDLRLRQAAELSRACGLLARLAAV